MLLIAVGCNDSSESGETSEQAAEATSEQPQPEPQPHPDPVPADKPLVFTIDLEKPLPSYWVNIPYGGNVESSNITVQFEVTARGTRSFASESKQQDPVGVNKSFEAEIMLGKHVTPAVGKIPANTLKLVGDVLTRLSYDAVKKEFRIYVKPSTDVIAGRPDAFKIGLSAQQCIERKANIEATIGKFENEIPMLVINKNALGKELVVLQKALVAAGNAKNARQVAQIGADMARFRVQWQGQVNNQRSKIQQLVALRYNLEYLTSLARNLGELKYLDIRYRIYQKVDDRNVLIIDGW